MNHLDFKSALIGGLIVCCFLLLTGQTKSNNLGDIEVNSITIKDNGYGGVIQIYNDKNERVGFLGANKYGDGMILLSDKDGDLTVGLSNDDGGFVQTYSKGLNWALLGSDNQGGYMSLRRGKDDVYFGAMVSDNKPWIGFWDQFGNFIWGQGKD